MGQSGDWPPPASIARIVDSRYLARNGTRMTPSILTLFLALFARRWSLATALLGLNLAHARATAGRVPPALAGRVPAETARRGAEYTLARGRLGLLEHFLGAPFVLALLFSGLLPALDGGLAAGWGPLPALGGLHRSAVFLLALGAIAGLAGLPFSLYSTFAIEQRFGFNRQPLAGWLPGRLEGGGGPPGSA